MSPNDAPADLLTIGQLDRVARWLGGPPDFVVVDAREGEPRATIAHRRAWAHGGWRLTRLATGDAGDVARLGLPVALASGTSPGADLPAALARSGVPFRHFVWGAGTGLVPADRAGAPPPPPAAPATTLWVALDREERLAPVELPVELDVELDPAAGALELGLRIECGSGTPPPGWWRAEGAGRGRLRVDLAARPGGDAWHVTLEGARLVRVDRAPAAVPARLAVIVDRTCPDEAGWSGARALAGEPPSSDYREFNRAVRTGLARALREGLEGHGAHVSLWAFADVPGDGLAALEGVDHPVSAVQELGAGAVERVPAWLQSASYAPGLDVWDPLEEALEQALAASPRAVLIVGNSPPQVLAAPGTPFGDLASAAGFPTTFRRYGPAWDRALERCRAAGIRLACAFLEHDVFLPDEQREHEAYALVARRVREGLARCLPVVSGPASEEGTRAAVAEALVLLSRPDPRPCGVRLIRD